MSKQKQATDEPAAPDGRLFRKIGGTAYQVNVFFSRKSKETMSDKIKRMIKSEAV